MSIPTALTLATPVVHLPAQQVPPTVATPAPTPSPQPVVRVATPLVSAPPSTSTSHANPAPLRPRQLERYPLAPSGRLAFAWSADGQQILYGGDQLYLFDTLAHQSRILTHDLYMLDSYAHLFPAWDIEHNVIVYARRVSDTHADIIAIHPDGQHVQTFVSNVFIKQGWEILRQDARQRANAVPLSLFNVSIAANGRVGLLTDHELISMRSGEPDHHIALPPRVIQQLAVLTSNDHHQLWLAPDGQHYALAITETLTLYHSTSPTPLKSFSFAEGYTDDPTIIYHLAWSPDSGALFYVLAYVEDVGNYGLGGIYAQRLTESVPQPLGRGAKVPRMPGVGGLSFDAAWSADGQWLAVGQHLMPHCSGTATGCLESQIIINPFAAQASVVWTEESFIADAVVWSPDGTKIARPCYRNQPDAQAEMCILRLEQYRP